jgi:hypothetical protein
MEFDKSGRLFTFGCSSTNYIWTTWADILGKEFAYYENWGLIGAGNQYMFNSLIECHHRNKFHAGDNVIIQWSNVSREDRYLQKKWKPSGNIYTQTMYPQDFVKNFADDRGYLIRDLATISAVVDLLEHWKVNYAFLSTVPMTVFGEYYISGEADADVLDLYKSALEKIRPSQYEAVFNFDWHSTISPEEYAVHAGASWPTHAEFMSGHNGTDPRIQDEIKKFRKNYLLQDTEVSPRDFFTFANLNKFMGKNLKIRDTHPRPRDALTYLQKVLPEISLSHDTVAWAQQKHLDVVVHGKFQTSRLYINRL